jgi:hypothetical protein
MSDIARTARIEDAMTQYGIPYPKKPLNEHRFIRWGKNGRYYGRLFNAEGGVFGDWQSSLKVLWFAHNENQKISRQELQQKRHKIHDKRIEMDREAYACQSKLQQKIILILKRKPLNLLEAEFFLMVDWLSLTMIQMVSFGHYKPLIIMGISYFQRAHVKKECFTSSVIYVVQSIFILVKALVQWRPFIWQQETLLW